MIAAHVGCMRHLAALKAGLKDKHGAEGGGWQLHIDGALGELAVAKATKMYWSAGINTFSASDLGENVQVRTRSRHDYELIVRDNDSESDTFVLVTGIAPSYKVRGWINGSAAKRNEWLCAHGGREAAYFVPIDSLRDMSELINKDSF